MIDTEVIIDDGTLTTGVPENKELISAYTGIIKEVSRYATPGTTVVRKIAITNGFIHGDNMNGYYVELNPSAPICTDLIVPGEFVGSVAGMKFDLSNVRKKFSGIGDMRSAMGEEIKWACPMIDEANEHIFAGPDVIFGRGKGHAAKLWSHSVNPVGKDAAKWVAGIDKKGFVGIFAHENEGIIIVCCRTIPAATWMHKRLLEGDSPHKDAKATYQDIISCPEYTRIVDLGMRNVKRLVHRVAVAIGIPAIGIIDADSVASEQSLPIDGTREAIISATAKYPLVTIPTYYNALDVFFPIYHPGETLQSVQYFNSQSPTSASVTKGGFISAKKADAKDESISVYEFEAPLTSKPYFDGCLNFLRIGQSPPHPFHSDVPHVDYEPLVIMKGSGH